MARRRRTFTPRMARAGVTKAATLLHAVDSSLLRLSRPSLLWVVVALPPLLFGTAGVIRTFPFEDDVSVAAAPMDDWQWYKLRALSILSGGLSMPGVDGPYDQPAGFLYNYFLAGAFAVFGENSSARLFPWCHRSCCWR